MQIQTYESVRSILNKIVEDYPASDLAVQIILKDEIEGLDVARLDQFLAEQDQETETSLTETTPNVVPEAPKGEVAAVLPEDGQTLEFSEPYIDTLEPELQRAECVARTFTATSTSELQLKLLVGEGGIIEGLPELIAPVSPSSEERSDYLSLIAALDDCAPFESLIFGGEFVATTSSDGSVVFVSSIDSQTSEITENDLKLTRDTRREIQRRLTLIGHDTKGVDGSLGKNSRTAIIEWQIANKLLPTGYLNDSQISALKEDSAEEYAAWEKEEASKPKKKKRRVKLCKRGLLGVLYDCRYVWR
ncbi:peptidoglycan-binding domain-containing protein [Roseovarius sp. ZX-A-9]|uniref:peptidoglycan-binding domain-containing protein n=1 Tax=Roseovarius sp. ZX-A-9 TaxID=3014783 RepID=UPI00232E8E36|nr:peptidoglycan-binding domain-containing protein [Roseovarius sp. ZX-A-9]